MAFPAAGVFAAGPTVTAGQTALDDWLAATKQLPGGAVETELTISSGSVTATIGLHSIDGESDADDTLTNIVMTSMSSFWLMIRAENAARIITLTHAAGGAGQMSFLGGQDVVLDATTQYVLFWADTGASPTTWNEFARGGFDLSQTVEVSTAVAASPNVLLASESGKVITNKGVAAQGYQTLPTARAGLEFTFICDDANGLRITAAASDTISHAATTSAAAGYIANAAAGSFVRLVAIDAVKWVVIGSAGTWTVDS